MRKIFDFQTEEFSAFATLELEIEYSIKVADSPCSVSYRYDSDSFTQLIKYNSNGLRLNEKFAIPKDLSATSITIQFKAEPVTSYCFIDDFYLRATSTASPTEQIATTTPTQVPTQLPIKQPTNCLFVRWRFPSRSVMITSPYVLSKFEFVLPAPKFTHSPTTQSPRCPWCDLLVFPWKIDPPTSPPILHFSGEFSWD